VSALDHAKTGASALVQMSTLDSAGENALVQGASALVQIRFVTGRGFVSDLISRGEYGFWATHAEAVMPDASLLCAHIDGGVQARPHGYDAATTTRERIATIAMTPDQAQRFYAFLRAQLGKPYDMRVIEQIAASAFLGERDWRQPDHWICSELQAGALEDCGFYPTPLATDVHHITPRDLLLNLNGRAGVSISE